MTSWWFIVWYLICCAIQTKTTDYSPLQRCLFGTTAAKRLFVFARSGAQHDDAILQDVHKSKMALLNVNLKETKANFLMEQISTYNHLEIIVFVEDFDTLEEIINQSHHVRRGAQVAIICLLNQDSKILKLQVFTMLIPPSKDVALILKERGSTLSNSPNCSTTIHSLLVFNYEKKKFRLSAFKSITMEKNGSTYKGADANIVNLILSHMKLQLEFTTPMDGYSFGEDINVSGALGQVARGEAEMVLNSAIFNSDLQLVDHTYPYTRDDLIILVPKTYAPRHVAVSPELVAFLIIPIILLVFLYFKLCQKLSIIDTCLICTRILTMRAIKHQNQSKLFRLIYAVILTLTFFCSTLFSLQVFSHKTQGSFLVKIGTIEEFAHTQMRLTSRPGLLKSLQDTLQNHTSKNSILSRIDTYPFGLDEFNHEWAYLQNCSNHAVLCRTHTFAYYVHYQKIRSRHVCYNRVQESLMPSLNSYIISLRNPYRERLNSLLSRIVEAGLVIKFNQLVHESDTGNIGVRFNRSVNLFFLVMFLVGLGVACLVFTAELFVYTFQASLRQ